MAKQKQKKLNLLTRAKALAGLSLLSLAVVASIFAFELDFGRWFAVLGPVLLLNVVIGLWIVQPVTQRFSELSQRTMLRNVLLVTLSAVPSVTGIFIWGSEDLLWNAVFYLVALTMWSLVLLLVVLPLILFIYITDVIIAQKNASRTLKYINKLIKTTFYLGLVAILVGAFFVAHAVATAS